MGIPKKKGKSKFGTRPDLAQKPGISKPKKQNPFELKFNRNKHNVLGQKKGTIVGMPGVSRKRAFEHREKTLGVERDRVGKVSKIVDKRIGEKLNDKTDEEKSFMRFAAEKSKHIKSNKFALEDDDDDAVVLTHRGQALSEIQKFDRGEHSDDDEIGGDLGADIEIVAKSKKAKYDRQQTKDEMEAKTESLDERFKKLQEKLQKTLRPPGANKEEKAEKDDYDRLAALLKTEEDRKTSSSQNPTSLVQTNTIADEARILHEMEKERVLKIKPECLPFVFKMPKKYIQFEALVKMYPDSALDDILNRLLTLYHPSLQEGNKERLKKLFVFLLRHFDVVSRTPPTNESMKTLETLGIHIHSLLKIDIEHCVECFRNMLTSNFTKNRKRLNVFHVVSLLRLSSSLFPTSDSFHPVTTLSLQMAVHFLAHAKITNLQTFAQFTVLATALLDHIREGKQFVPELVGFIQFSLDQAVQKNPENPGHQLTTQFAGLDFLGPTTSTAKHPSELKPEDVFSDEKKKNFQDSPQNRCGILRRLLALTDQIRMLYLVHTHSYKAVFRPILSILRNVESRKDLPILVRDELKMLSGSLEETMTAKTPDLELRQLSRARNEKSMLKMLEPRFEENFDPERPRTNRDPSRKGAAAEKKKLEHLVKKEKKGAIKELRKDGRFLANKQLATIKAADKDRRMKTKRILGGLAEQQGEWNREKREKK
ncbi:hypothetical protein WR25_12518 [Diploscapter pachys]|uniref:Nucleolar protein 14 n=1 Tax=Diploscapter pachys TaxID=2018661 RepID=A0A2A2JUX8_9BILA|nr:hypothetical protein WR25_12518 [Diploscapter pachys]